MNKPIRTISIFCLLLFLALMVNATWLQYWKSDAYHKDPRNRRVIEAAYSRERGAILEQALVKARVLGQFDELDEADRLSGDKVGRDDLLILSVPDHERGAFEDGGEQ